MPDDTNCEHSDIPFRLGTPDFELFFTKKELEEGGDLKHGAHHLERLLSLDPGNIDYQKLFDRYLEAIPDLEKLIPQTERLFYTTESMRAYIWLKTGRLEESLELLASIVRSHLDALFLETWALPAIEPTDVIEQLPFELAEQLFPLALCRFPEAIRCTGQQLDYLKRWAQLCDRYLLAHPEANVPHVQYAHAGLFRKAGQFDYALEIAQRNFAIRPDWFNAVSVARVLSRSGHPEEAEEYFKKAIESAPEEKSTAIEAADAFFDAGDWQKALGWYEEALKKSPRHKWAKPSAVYCQWKLTGKQNLLKDLTKRANAGNERAAELSLKASNGGLG